MKYVYPAIFTPLEETPGGYDVYIPDLPVCRTFGNTLAEAIEMGEDAASMWLWDAENNNEPAPAPAPTLPHDPPQFISFIKADTDTYRRRSANTKASNTRNKNRNKGADT